MPLTMATTIKPMISITTDSSIRVKASLAEPLLFGSLWLSDLVNDRGFMNDRGLVNDKGLVILFLINKNERKKKSFLEFCVINWIFELNMSNKEGIKTVKYFSIFLFVANSICKINSQNF